MNISAGAFPGRSEHLAKRLRLIQTQTCCVYPAWPAPLPCVTQISPQQELGRSQGWVERESRIFWQAVCSFITSAAPILSPFQLHYSAAYIFLHSHRICLSLFRHLLQGCTQRFGKQAEDSSLDYSLEKDWDWRLVSCQVLINLDNYSE